MNEEAPSFTVNKSNAYSFICDINLLKRNHVQLLHKDYSFIICFSPEFIY